MNTKLNKKPLELFFNNLSLFIDNKELVRMILSSKKDKTSDLKNIIITLIKLKEAYKLNFVYRHDTRDITKNYDFEVGKNLIFNFIKDSFYNADISTSKEKINLITNSKGNARLKTSKVSTTPPQSFNHDKVKNRIIKTQENIYLRELDVVNSKGSIYHNKIDKYKQINQYIELISPYLKKLPLETSLSITDMGSGKGYLTFALYDYLTQTLNVSHRVNQRFNISGVEFRQELVDKCNIIAKKANFTALTFVQGDIKHTEIKKIDVLIALHACDTATDDAIFRGIKAKSSLIVCAPCCHKQIRKALNVKNELSAIVEHGILKERQAEIITDTLRALIMEYFGYKTKVFEFISTEHTAKNLMIIGERKGESHVNKIAILKKITMIKTIYGINQHYLEKLLEI